MEKIVSQIRFFATRNQGDRRQEHGQAFGQKQAPFESSDSFEEPKAKPGPQQAATHERREGAEETSHRRPVKRTQETNDANEEEDDGRAAKSSDKLGRSNSSLALYECITPATRSRLNTLTQIGEDWLYLALLGIIMALLSLSMDSVITIFLGTRIWLSEEASEQNWLLQYLAWCITPILLVTFSTGFVHLCSPTAIGSGIPEMKTILRGVVLNEYLTFRTLIAKIVGLTFTLGSGLPLGKEGPSVHMASIVATLLSKLVASFQGIYENESRTSEMLSAACAVGVAATFYAPIGGVLFSIEVTTVYFAVRNYWRGFFAACCGATIWRLLGFYIKNDESISAIFKTNFSTDYPFDPVELVVFSFIGATCGLAGAAYIKFHREIVQFFRRHKRISGFLQQNRFVYPTLVTLIITTSTFPPFLGKYTAATLSTHTTIEHLFSNRTWSRGGQDLVSRRILDDWTTPHTSFYLHLVLYIITLFWTSALASTIPTPSGVFIPVVKMGAAYGRLIGELMAAAYPDGIKYSHPATIVPGSYAVVGAAALSGAVTHTVSTSVILFEMTGQIVHIIPVILAVLIANAVCQSLQPSIYDSIIEIKKLPYLPPIASSNSISHRILVKDFMNTNIPFVWKEKCTYADLKSLLATHRKIISFPLVESPHSMKLLGSVARPDLLKLLYLHLGRERRLQEVCRRNSDTLTPAIQLLSTISGGRVADEWPAKIESPLAVCNRSIGVSIDQPLTPPDKPDDSDDGGIEFKRPERGPREELKLHQEEEANSAHPMHHLAVPTSDVCDRVLERMRKCNINSGDYNASRLIASAVKRPLNYGATGESAHPARALQHQAGPHFDQSLGESKLLSLCQEGALAHEEEEYKRFNSVAKVVNHYDRGSSLDEDLLNSSIQQVENHLAQSARQANCGVTIVVSQEPQIAMGAQERNGGDMKLPQCHTRSEMDASPHSSVDSTKSASDSSASAAAISSRPSQQMEPIKTQPMQMGRAKRASVRRSLRQLGTASCNQTPASSPSLSSRPTKSILKTSSFNHMPHKRMISNSKSFTSAYDKHPLDTRNSSPSNIKFTLVPEHQAQNGPLMKSFLVGSVEMSQLADKQLDPEAAQSAPVRQRRKVRLPRLRVVDMTPEEQEQWEREQLSAHIDITRCQIDEAPFQLVEQTSLYRVHTLFSMLGLNHAYVTSFGRLVGIVALKDIRFAIEKMLQEK